MMINNPPVEITENITMFGTNEYPLYLVQGEGEAALFEGASGPMGPLFREQAADQCVDLDSIKQIVIPHAHPDHVMAVPYLRTLLPNARVAASEIAAATLNSDKAVGFFCKLDDAVSDWMLQMGSITEAHRRPPFEPMQIAVDETLKEGDAVTVDGLSFQVLQTPGHSDCSLSFFEPGKGLLIASDALPYYLPNQAFWWPCYFGSYGAFLDSMQRLADLNAEVLCLGHQGAIRGAEAVKQFFAEAREATESYHQRIVSANQAGQSIREIGEQMGSEMHAQLQSLPVDFFQKNCGLLAKLSLRHEGIQDA